MTGITPSRLKSQILRSNRPMSKFEFSIQMTSVRASKYHHAWLALREDKPSRTVDSCTTFTPPAFARVAAAIRHATLPSNTIVFNIT